MFYVYKITNLANGKIYIGETGNIKQRWDSHKYAAKRGRQKNDPHNRYQYVHRAIRKWGPDNFTMEKIAEFETEKEALRAEIEFVAQYKSNDRNIGYNLTRGGDGASGYKFSKKQKEEMSRKRKGVYVGEKNPFYGKKHTDESRKKISDKAKLRTGNKNHFYGKHHTDETKKKTKETKIKNGTLGKKRYLSDEQINDVRKKHASGYSYKSLALEYNIGQCVIENIVLYKRSYAKDKPENYIRSNKYLRIPKDEADLIRKRFAAGEVTQDELAAQYGINKRTINALINFRSTYANDGIKQPREMKIIQLEERKKIRKIYSEGNITQKELARIYKVSRITMSRIINCKHQYKCDASSKSK